jgi:hypothetical protein
MAAKTEVEIGVRDKASTELKGIQGAFERMRISVETNSKGINKLDNAFRGLGAQAAALPGPFGRVADALMDFAPGGLVGGAVVAGIALIALEMNKQKERQKELITLTDESKKINESLRLSYIRLTEGVEAYNKELATTNVTEANNQLVKATTELENFFNEIKLSAEATVNTFNDMGAAGGRILTDAERRKRVEDEIGKALQRRALEQAVLVKKVENAENTRRVASIAAQQQAQDQAIANTRDTATAEQKRLQDQFSEFQQLFKLQADGYVLNEERQNKLNQLSNQYADILNDVNAPLDKIKFATQAVDIVTTHITAEYDKQLKTQEEQAKTAKDLAEEQKKLAKEAEERQKKAFENSARYNSFLSAQILSSERKLSDEQIAFVKQRIEEQQANLALFGLRGNTEGMIAATEQLDKLQQGAVAQIQQTPIFAGIEAGVNALADGFSAMGAAIASGQNALSAFGKAAKQAIGQSLQILGREQLVKGLGNLASGFAASALGPIGGKSAKDFFKAAGFNFSAAALAGAAGGAFGGTSPGGGGGAGVGGGGFSNSQLGRSNFTTQPVTIIVQGGSLLDMSNPDTQRSFVSAMETVTNRRVRMVGA